MVISSRSQGKLPWYFPGTPRSCAIEVIPWHRYLRKTSANGPLLASATSAIDPSPLLTFEDNPHRRRAKLVRLTEKRQGTYAQITKIQTRWVNSISRDLDESELNAAVDLLRTIETRLQQQGTP